MSEQVSSPAPWSDDVLNRRRFSEFLTASLNEKNALLAADGINGMTVSLDADWGTGKSFFVRR